METCAPIRKAQLSVSYFHKPGGRPLLCCTTGDVVDKTAEAWGDRIAVVSCHQELSKTYTEFKKDVSALTVLSGGVTPSDGDAMKLPLLGAGRPSLHLFADDWPICSGTVTHFLVLCISLFYR